MARRLDCYRIMSAYRLRFLDPSGKFIRADRIESRCDRDAVAAAHDRRLRVRSELWLGSRLVAKVPPMRRADVASRA